MIQCFASMLVQCNVDRCCLLPLAAPLSLILAVATTQKKRNDEKAFRETRSIWILDQGEETKDLVYFKTLKTTASSTDFSPTRLESSPRADSQLESLKDKERTRKSND